MTDTRMEPCPFCGCSDIDNKDDGDFEWMECRYCGATSGYDEAFPEKSAEDQWNTRTPAPEAGLRDVKNAPDWEGFGRALMEDWPTGDIDGSHLFDMSLKYGLIAEVPGGYNPDEHIDAEGICPETGDPWYEYAFGTQPATEQRLARNQPCGCIVCHCEDDEQCHGCGAKSCGNHPVGEIPNPVYADTPAPVAGWRDIGSAPKDGTRFLAYEKSGDYCISECWWEHDWQEWSGWQNDWDSEPNPTHWMPLPPAPGEPATEQPSVKEAARDVAFLEEAAKYFERRDTGGEDRAFWSNVANAENCRRIAKKYAALRSLAQGDE